MKWRYFAERELPRVIRDLGIPCAREPHATGMTRCPRHDEPLGKTTRVCLACHDEAWDEVARRYRERDRPAQPEPQHQEEEPQMSTTSDIELAERELLPAMTEEPMSAPITLFGTSDPKIALARMADDAKAVVEVIDDQKLYAPISGKKYVKVHRLEDGGRHVRPLPPTRCGHGQTRRETATSPGSRPHPGWAHNRGRRGRMRPRRGPLEGQASARAALDGGDESNLARIPRAARANLRDGGLPACRGGGDVGHCRRREAREGTTRRRSEQ